MSPLARSTFQLAIAAVLFTATLLHAEVIESDICVFGGTSAGVVAAVQSARMGKKVVLTDFG
ncbi:MAG: FAD-dependent oxidoreductase, partial [Limisphaerales bacterium]